MEEMQVLAKRIETNHDDLQAWHRLGELVDDPEKKKDCRDQVTRINNAHSGIHEVIHCERCGASMQVIPGELGSLAMAICPDCPHTMELENGPKPVMQAGDTATASGQALTGTNFPQGRLPVFVINSANFMQAFGIIAVNLLPAFGILFLGWSMVSIMVLYWIENVIVGFFTILKMAFATAETEGSVTKLFMIPFFCVHYGIFCAAHAFFIFMIFLVGTARSGSGNLLIPLVQSGFELAGLSIPILGMFINYGISFYLNYIKSGMYRYASLNSLMSEPYPRIVPLHIGLILGGFVILSLGSPVWIVLILVALKTGAEVLTYRHSMTKWQSQTEKM
jgi:hypothetical protein